MFAIVLFMCTLTSGSLCYIDLWVVYMAVIMNVLVFMLSVMNPAPLLFGGS